MTASLTRDFPAEARAILAANDRGGYTVPTARLYPFQWNWDSAFVAMGFATYDPARAFTELERLIEGQWPDGMIPHIVFHAASDDYFPGPDVWGTAAKCRPDGPATSGITQPAVFATALRRVFEAATASDRAAAVARAKPLFAAALRSHRWWHAARDPDGSGLVSVQHNWETGSDNSPAFDDALARVPTTTTTVIRRKDTGHVAAAMRPRDVDYQRYIHIVDVYRDAGWDAKKQWQVAPFKIADVQMTAILLRASEDLGALARHLGTPDEQREIAGHMTRLAVGLRRQWSPSHCRFLSHDRISGRDIASPTQAGFMPLAALGLEDEQKRLMAREIERWLDDQAIDCLPSAPNFSPDFEAQRYWRGPVWAIINWYVVAGLRRNGIDALAARIERGMVRAIEEAGFAEYFDPMTGEGCGGQSFSWTAAAYLLMMRPS